jgi:hypothetical protein
MNTNLLPSPISGRFLLLVAPDALAGHLFEMIAYLALQGPLCVLDGGNMFQGYALARALRQQVRDIRPPLQRVLLSRAFTCYQMAALLDGLRAKDDFSPQPVLVLDFLGSFYDQDIRIYERRRLLQACIRALQGLARRAPLAVWVRQRSSVPVEALNFLEMVQNAAGQIWYPPRVSPLVGALPTLRQAELFPGDA